MITTVSAEEPGRKDRAGCHSRTATSPSQGSFLLELPRPIHQPRKPPGEVSELWSPQPEALDSRPAWLHAAEFRPPVRTGDPNLTALHAGPLSEFAVAGEAVITLLQDAATPPTQDREAGTSIEESRVKLYPHSCEQTTIHGLPEMSKLHQTGELSSEAQKEARDPTFVR